MGGVVKFWMLVWIAAGCGDNWESPHARVGRVCPELVVREVNDTWIAEHDDPGDAAWERATYFIGNTVAADAFQEPRYLDYTRAWAQRHRFQINEETTTRNADNHAAGQVYLDLFERDGGVDGRYIADIKASLDHIVRGRERGDWSWIDAQFMASPTFAHLGELSQDPRYHDTMFELYTYARDRRHLFDAATGLWFRDENYLYPDETTPDGKKIFWARGNGWVFGSLPRTLEHLGSDSPYRADYEDMLRAMATGLAKAQRSDGTWGVSLADPRHWPGPEASGTSFFLYGLAWGVRSGILDAGEYVPVIERGWRGLATIAVRSDGELGYVQGVGEKPASSQPVKLRSTHDFGTGAFLLAGSEIHMLGLPFDCSP
jgi:unsaturated rhamnogalacturonyl hydrolase